MPVLSLHTFESSPPFGFNSDSETARLFHETDWSATPLGPIDSWPTCLRTAVSICLNSRFPMFVWWGPQLVNIYNDAYIPILGKRHPDAFGKPAKPTWHEIWPVVGPQADLVMTEGRATWNERVLLVMERNGYVEDTYFTWSYSPIHDESGAIAGLFCACTEETQRVRAERERDRLLVELDSERARLADAFKQSPAFIAVMRGRDHVFEFANEQYMRMVGGRRDILNRAVREALPEIAGQGFFELLDHVYDSGEPFVGTGMRVMLSRQQDQPLEERFIDFVYQPLRSTDGPINGILVHGVDVTERRVAEEGLRASEQQMRLLTDALPALIAYVGADHVYRFNNRAYIDWFGKTVHQVTGQHMRDVLGDETYQQRLPYVERALAGETVRFEGPTRHHNRGERLSELLYVPDVAPDGRIPGFVVLVQDVTERRTSEARDKFLVALEEAVRPLDDPAQISATCARLLAEHLQADRCAYADVEADQDTFNLTGNFNRGVPSIIGRYRFADFGAECLQLMREAKPYVVYDIDTHQPPVDVASYRLTMIQAVICVPLHKAGRFVAAMAVHQKVPRRWMKDEIDLVLHVANRCYESIERARVERELRESESRFRDAFEHAPIGMTTNEPDGRYVHVNPAYCQIIGYSREELLNPSFDFRRLSHPDDLPMMLALQRKLLAGTIPAFFIEKRYIRKDGTMIWVRVSGVARRDERGRPFQFIRLVENIDDRKRAEQERDALLDSERAARAEAERASEAKSEFLATLSHELRTPLTPVMLTASMLENNPKLPPELRDDVTLIRRNVELESRLISDLLDLTRIARGKLQLDMQDVDLHSVIRSAIDICQREASAKLHIELNAKKHHVRGDSTRLQQIFWNLVNNAIKFTGADGTVTVRSCDAPDCGAPDGRVRVEVIDTGSGIDAALLPRLFTAFEQGEVRTIRQQAGLGLGLAISKRLSEAHGGSIRASSEGAGRGATFTVELPAFQRAVHEIRHAPDAKSEPAHPSVRGLKVLLIEDHDPTLRVMSKLLRSLGHRVTGASSVASATAAARQDGFDLIISDLGLPDGSGLDVMRAVRDKYHGRAIALTGYGMDTDIEASREAGFADHLTKPVDLEKLQRAIARLVETHVIDE